MLASELCTAIQDNNIQLMNKIIDKGADLNVIYEYKLPLGWSIDSNNVEATRILLSRGADPNPIINTTPLIFCVQNRNLEIAKCLIESGANVCDPGSTGKTPLMWAVESQEIEMIQLFLDNGADLTSYSCLMETLRTNRLEISGLLIQNCPTMNFFDKEGLTPLIVSLQQESADFKIIDTLVKKGADVNKRSLKGDVPITLAVCSRRWDLVGLLLKNGAHIDTNSLIKCIQTGDFNLLKEIMKFDIDVNTCDDKGNFPVMSVIEMRNLDMLRFLIQKGAKLDISDKNQDTPLLKAVRSVNLKMVKYLVGQGVDINRKDKNGETALAVTLSRHDFPTFDFLVKSGAVLDLVSEKIEKTRKENDDFAIYLEFLKNEKRAELVEMKGQEEAKD